MELKNTFQKLAGKYTGNLLLIEKFWRELENNYSGRKRYYHTLSHPENMRLELVQVQKEIKDWDVILFALFYHDAIYKPTSNNNEENSAGLAEVRLSEIGFPTNNIIKCKEAILTTRLHNKSSDADINYFVDSDLSVLGQNWNDYLAYTNGIRKEYSIYPDFVYISGRKKVLNHFLKMARIYKTDFFFGKYEKQAKENLTREITMLG